MNKHNLFNQTTIVILTTQIRFERDQIMQLETAANLHASSRLINKYFFRSHYSNFE